MIWRNIAIQLPSYQWFLECHSIYSLQSRSSWLHGSPTSGHLSMFKTLSQTKSWFIWPCCTSDIKLWVTTCSHCITVQSSGRVSSELCFSWPITAPFSIVHVDLWSSGVAISTDRYTHMCLVPCATSLALSSLPLSNPSFPTTLL